MLLEGQLSCPRVITVNVCSRSLMKRLFCVSAYMAMSMALERLFRVTHFILAPPHWCPHSLAQKKHSLMLQPPVEQSRTWAVLGSNSVVM